MLLGKNKRKSSGPVSAVRRRAALVMLPLAAALAAPVQAEQAPPAPAALEQPAAPAAQADAAVLEELKGLVFVSAMTDVQAAGVSATGVDATRVPLLDNAEFAALAAPYLGQRLTLGALQGLVDKIVVFCREHDRPVVDVMVPEQDVTAGTVQIVVLEGRLGTVSTVGNRWFKSDFLIGQIRLKPGEPVSAKTLNEDLAWLNRNPFRHVDAVFVQGSRPGTTDIQLQVRERYPLRVYGSYQNSGNAIIGKDIYSVGANWGNVFDTDQQAGYQYDRSGKADTLEAHHLNYSLPLPWRHVVSLSASHVTTESNLFNAFGLGGRSTRVGARYGMPLPSPRASVEHGVQLGVDYKRSNNNLEFFGTQIFDDSTDIVQLVAQYDGAAQDGYGVNSWYGKLVMSPGGLTGDNSDETFAATRAGATARYNYLQLGYARQTRLPKDYSWSLKADAQFADSRLLASEQFGVGGQSSVRGFEEREANGDSGVLLSNELRTPSLRLPSGGWFAERSELQLLAFLDVGLAATHDARNGEADRRELAGTGVGLRYRLGNNATVQADYGWQLAGEDIDPADDTRLHMNILLSY